LYYDSKRVGTFLSQFDNFGHLQELTSGENASRGGSEDFSGTVTGGVPLIASGEASANKNHTLEHGQNSQRTYNPLWTNALTFLDFLSERNLLQKNLKEAKIGDFVLHSGTLSIVDLKLVNEVWQAPTMKKMMRGGAQEKLSRSQRRGQAKNSTENSGSDELEMFFEMMKILPHTIQATISGEDVYSDAWCSLIDEYMVTSTSDVVLKHGYKIPGTWHIVGIFDADREIGFQEDNLGSFDVGDGTGIAKNMMKLLAPISKKLLGRPDENYGITPLLIFRQTGSN